MIGETIVNPAFAVEGIVVAGPLPIDAGHSSLGVRFDGNAGNPDCQIDIVCEFSGDGGTTWHTLGAVTINARSVAADLPDFPGSAYTIMGSHDGSAGLGRLTVTCAQPATFVVATNF